MAKNKLYAVRIGRIPGIYTDWSQCESQIKGFSGAEYKSFTNIDDANEYMNPIPAIFIDTCPECGVKGSLEVVSATCYLKGVALESDGFVIRSAKDISTEAESIKCKECETEFDLDDLTIKKE